MHTHTRTHAHWTLAALRDPAPTQEYTNYHFEVAPASLHGALERFAQFFVAPLFQVRRGGTGCLGPAVAAQPALTNSHTTCRGLPRSLCPRARVCACLWVHPRAPAPALTRHHPGTRPPRRAARSPVRCSAR
jgi:hypothetical protein